MGLAGVQLWQQRAALHGQKWGNEEELLGTAVPYRSTYNKHPDGSHMQVPGCLQWLQSSIISPLSCQPSLGKVLCIALLTGCGKLYRVKCAHPRLVLIRVPQ